MTTSPPSADRFIVPVSDCEVKRKDKLVEYRENWMRWMSWYEYSDSKPNTIESQIHTMLFTEITYRAIVSVRTFVAADIPISARSATLAYLLDQGYVLSQVLAIQRLLDGRKDVLSLKQLLNDVDKHRSLFTREIYVAGDGLPYDPDSWTNTVDEQDPMIKMWGIDAPGLRQFVVSKARHETFDLLSGKKAHERARDDLISKSVFTTLHQWISGPSAKEITFIRNNFLAHAGDAVRQGSVQFQGVKFTQIDELQRAIVRVERAVTDHILTIQVARDVVPMPPLGIFKGLGLPYCTSQAEESMHQQWDELSAQREAWKGGVLEELTSHLSH